MNKKKASKAVRGKPAASAAPAAPGTAPAPGTAAAGGITAIGLRSYITAFVVLIALMVVAYALTLTLPAGEFDRVATDGSSAASVIPGSYHEVDGGLPFWKWLLSPVLVLGESNGFTLVMLLIFLFCIGGSFFALESCGVLTYLITSLAKRFEHNNRILLFLLPLVFMLLGSMIGSFEETIPLAAIVVALALRLGWDRFQGLGMSLLAVGCGFAVGIMNPFTVGIAQSIAGLPMFSGVSLRIISFLLVYALLMAFLVFNARRLEKGAAFGPATATTAAAAAASPSAVAPAETVARAAAGTAVAAAPARPAARPAAGTVKADAVSEGLSSAMEGLGSKANDQPMARAFRAFVVILLIDIAAIIACSVLPVPGLVDLVFPVTALAFLLCGVIATLFTGCGGRQLAKWFVSGMRAIAPGALLVLMASSISYMLTEGKVLDTIIFYAGNWLSDSPDWLAILGIYLLVLLLEFAIASGSAKAFLLVPLLAPLVDMIGIPRQLAVVAYAFGDGFTNVFYPTNPALLIALSICGLSYRQWIRRSWRFLLGLLVLTSLILVSALALGYS